MILVFKAFHAIDISKTGQNQTNIKLEIPRDHPLASSGLYLYEVRMERRQRVITTDIQTGRPKLSDDFDSSQVWCPSDDQCFGILSREPLGHIPSFDLYDRLHLSGKNALGIITVSIVPIKE